MQNPPYRRAPNQPHWHTPTPRGQVVAPRHATAGNPNNPPTPWGKSTAKQLLRQDIISGETKKYRGPKGIWLSRPEYQKYKIDNFSSNYYSLRKSILSNLQVASAGKQALRHDEGRILEHRVQAGIFHYPGSNVQKALCSAVRSGETIGKTPSQIWASNPVYRRRGELKEGQLANFLAYERRRFEKKQQADNYQERMRFINARIDPRGEQLNEEEEEHVQGDDNQEEGT